MELGLSEIPSNWKQILYYHKDTVHQPHYEDDLSLESRVCEPEKGKKESILNAVRKKKKSESWLMCLNHNWLWQIFSLEAFNSSEALTAGKSWVLKYKN